MIYHLMQYRVSTLYCVLYCCVVCLLFHNAVAVSRVPFEAAGQAHVLTCYILCNAAAFCCVSGVAASVVCLVAQLVLCLVAEQVLCV
jgi:hypothetical protein